jgi:hypothetical protein
VALTVVCLKYVPFALFSPIRLRISSTIQVLKIFFVLGGDLPVVFLVFTVD